ncbi:MAG: ABC-F family ATP-binding cassette domain-containing protein [Vampirovibrionales bacterium]|nr:ABC-F family ATP-binding cassette domain-containing protein [Vampirovibrionales bacterium]
MTIQLHKISKHFNQQDVLSEVTLQINPQARIGLIGRNGSGKSTLLKIITGQLEPDSGTFSKTPGDEVAYLSQEPRITPGLTLYEEMLSAFERLNALEAEEKKLLLKLEALDNPSSHNAPLADEQMALAQRLNTLHQEMEHLGIREVDAKIGRILKGLGFSQADHQRKSSEFSGGWQMRINLAKILLEGAEVLLLDEPTNHLDLDACEWLENFLRDYSGALVIVSHDRRFLDEVVGDIAELEYGKLRLWPGNYSRYVEQKALEFEQLSAAFDRQQKEIAKQSAFVERFRASATRSTQAKSREKQLAKIERVEIPQHDKRRASFSFPEPQPSGSHILTLRNIQKSFGDHTLFTKLNAEFLRRQRIFLLGANGSGKTTLLRIILGLEAPDEGEVRLGHNALMAYFSQKQLDTLDPELTLFDTIQNACPKMGNTEVRTLLGRFLLSGEQVFKPVGVLSGGEKSKVALAKMMVSGPNTLLLDEPTNHIDISTKEVMTEALADYEGSILCISHDRYFIQELATDIWEIYNGHLLTYCGDYDYYLSKREEMRAKVNTTVNIHKHSPVLTASVKNNVQETASQNIQTDFRAKKEAEKQLRKIEKQIMALETDIEKLQASLNTPPLQEDYQKLQELSEKIGEKQRQLSALNDEWTILAEELS